MSHDDMVNEAREYAARFIRADARDYELAAQHYETIGIGYSGQRLRADARAAAFNEAADFLDRAIRDNP